jgi:hypothetical protein
MLRRDSSTELYFHSLKCVINLFSHWNKTKSGLTTLLSADFLPITSEFIFKDENSFMTDRWAGVSFQTNIQITLTMQEFNIWVHPTLDSQTDRTYTLVLCFWFFNQFITDSWLKETSRQKDGTVHESTGILVHCPPQRRPWPWLQSEEQLEDWCRKGRDA